MENKGCPYLAECRQACLNRPDHCVRKAIRDGERVEEAAEEPAKSSRRDAAWAGYGPYVLHKRIRRTDRV